MSESAKVASTPVSGKLVFIASYITLAASLYSAIESQVFNVYVLKILGKSPLHLTLMLLPSISRVMQIQHFTKTSVMYLQSIRFLIHLKL